MRFYQNTAFYVWNTPSKGSFGFSTRNRIRPPDRRKRDKYRTLVITDGKILRSYQPWFCDDVLSLDRYSCCIQDKIVCVFLIRKCFVPPFHSTQKSNDQNDEDNNILIRSEKTKQSTFRSTQPAPAVLEYRLTDRKTGYPTRKLPKSLNLQTITKFDTWWLSLELKFRSEIDWTILSAVSRNSGLPVQRLSSLHSHSGYKHSNSARRGSSSVIMTALPLPAWIIIIGHLSHVFVHFIWALFRIHPQWHFLNRDTAFTLVSDLDRLESKDKILRSVFRPTEMRKISKHPPRKSQSCIAESPCFPNTATPRHRQYQVFSTRLSTISIPWIIISEPRQ
jgi:hypothetical protein